MSSNVTYRVVLEKLGGTDINDYVGMFGDLFYDPYVGELRVSDGVTVGGYPSGVGPLSNVNGGTF